MNKKILYILYTYNRPNILKKCFETLFRANNTVFPSEVLIIDDGSNLELKDQLYSFCRENSKFIPFHFFSYAKNQGLGYNWELAWNWVRMHNFDYVAQIEQDYIFREDAIGEAIEVLEQKPLSLALSLMSNPDYWNGKQNTLFPEVMIQDFGFDPAKREYLHKPFYIDTSYGKIQIQTTTNSCGTFLCNWKRTKRLLDKYPEMWSHTFERSFNKPFPERRRYASDGAITSGLSFYWYKDVEDRIKEGENIDYSIEGPWLDVSDMSLSSHVNGGDSLNGYIVPELSSFINCHNWSDDYIINNPRKFL